MKIRTKACKECPWRKSNQGKRTKGGFYTKANLRRLWAGLRTGEAPGMTCHGADPRGKAIDAEPVEDLGGESKVECAGALLLVQRELRKIEADPSSYPFRLRTALARRGAWWWGIGRCAMADTPMGGPSMPVVEEDPDISGV